MKYLLTSIVLLAAVSVALHRDGYHSSGEMDAGHDCAYHLVDGPSYEAEDSDDTRRSTEIPWSPERRLRISDFQASNRNRSYQALTASGIRYDAETVAPHGRLYVELESFFTPEESYFTPSDRDSMVLLHEQLHFDITELHARKMRRAMQESIHSVRDFKRKHQRIFKQIQAEMDEMQQRYDRDVYADDSLQAGWVRYVTEEMSALESWAAKSFYLE